MGIDISDEYCRIAEERVLQIQPSLFDQVKNSHIVREISVQAQPHLMERVVGSETQNTVNRIEMNENLMLSVGTAKTVGKVYQATNNNIGVELRLPVCVENGTRIAISRNIDRRWRLIGWGIITGGKEQRMGS